MATLSGSRPMSHTTTGTAASLHAADGAQQAFQLLHLGFTVAPIVFGIDKFLGGNFAGDYQQALLDEFDRYLPERPPWKVE